MKLHAEEIFKRNFQFILFCGVCLISVISIAVSLVSISKAGRPLIIGIDSNGTRIVTEKSDPIYKTEAVAFIQKFIFNSYNFDSQNFMKRIGFATSFMSEDLWKKKRSEVLDLKIKVERDEISLNSEIQKMTLDDKTYHILVLAHEKNRMNEQAHKIEISMKLKDVKRSSENPFGLEVDSYEETPIRD